MIKSAKATTTASAKRAYVLHPKHPSSHNTAESLVPLAFIHTMLRFADTSNQLLKSCRCVPEIIGTGEFIVPDDWEKIVKTIHDTDPGSDDDPGEDDNNPDKDVDLGRPKCKTIRQMPLDQKYFHE
jgi:hypothetical protein